MKLNKSGLGINGLTPAKKKFAHEYAKTDNGRKSALRVWPEITPESAAVKATRLLKNANVSQEIEAQKAKMEFLASKAVIKIDQLLESDNENIASQNAWKVYEQVHGKALQKNVSISAHISLEDALSNLT